MLKRHRPHAHMPKMRMMRIPATAFALRSFAFVALIAASAAIFLVMPQAPTIAVIMAITEFVSYDVAVPELAQLRLSGYALTYESASDSLLGKNLASPTAKKPLCLTGLLTPNVGTRVSYKRIDTGPIVAVIERADGKPAATFSLSGAEAPAALQKASWIRLEASTDPDDKGACGGKPSLRLPVYGPSRIGTPLRPESVGEESSSGVLIEGTIDLYAKTVELKHLNEGANRIYPTTVVQMDIPPGAELSQFVEKGEHAVPWAGFVKPNPDLALDARITTPANRIQILRPGIGIEPETLSTSLFAQIVNDPVILSLQVFAVLIFSIFQAASSWIVARQAKVVAEESANEAKAAEREAAAIEAAVNQDVMKQAAARPPDNEKKED